MASKHSIVDFKSRLKGGGARPNLFQVEMTSIEDAETKVDFKSYMKTEGSNQSLMILLFHHTICF